VLNQAFSELYAPATIVNHISNLPSDVNYLILPPGNYITVAIMVAGSYSVVPVLKFPALFHPPAANRAVVLQSYAISAIVIVLLLTAIPGIGTDAADIRSEPTNMK